MAHTIDFTRLGGGIGTLPTSDVPFAGSFFDVQRETYQPPFFGVPIVFVEIIPEEYAGNIVEVGGATLFVQVFIDVPESAEQETLCGAVTVESCIDVFLNGSPETHAIGDSLELFLGVEVVPYGRETSVAYGYPVCTYPWTINPEQHERVASLGRPSVESIVELDLEGISKQQIYGVPDIDSIVVIYHVSYVNNYEIEAPSISYRKCAKQRIFSCVSGRFFMDASVAINHTVYTVPTKKDSREAMVRKATVSCE